MSGKFWVFSSPTTRTVWSFELRKMKPCHRVSLAVLMIIWFPSPVIVQNLSGDVLAQRIWTLVLTQIGWTEETFRRKKEQRVISSPDAAFSTISINSPYELTVKKSMKGSISSHGRQRSCCTYTDKNANALTSRVKRIFGIIVLIGDWASHQAESLLE